MYCYYLLGYRLFGDLETMEKLYKKKYGIGEDKNNTKAFKGFGNLLNNMDDKLRAQVSFWVICLKKISETIKNGVFNEQFKAENIFLLALDGDVDFRPEAVRLLVDRMKKNKKVGAACGRIHPIGSGKPHVLSLSITAL
jgi:hypothetical protein